MEGSSALIRAVQFCSWGGFILSWAQMGWVDWKEQKIRHRFLKFWLLFILAAYAVLVVHSLLGESGYAKVFIVRNYYLALLGHAAFSVGAAYTLWWLRIWPAGDVKLFVLLSLFYPLMRIPGSFRSGLLFLEVLINIFVPAAAFLFLTAGEYLWRTRFAIYKGHLAVRMGLYFKGLSMSKLDFSWVGPKLAELGTAVKTELAAVVAVYRENPKQLFIDGASWFAMMTAMSLISYALNDIITSNVLKTLFCFALMFTWSRFCQLIGTGWALGTVLSICAIWLYRHPNVNFPALAVIFGHITIFSLFIFLGMQFAFKIIAGKTGYMILPFLMMGYSLIPWRALVSGAWGWLSGLFPTLPDIQTPSLVSAFAFPDLAIWAVMGLAFGLSLVFVKIWDAESYKSIPIAHIGQFMTMGPALVARIQADDEFCDEHFSTFYADGLTGEQAEVLREWCRKEGIETVPIAPTMSFANWIFLGYFLTRLLEGHVLRFLY